MKRSARLVLAMILFGSAAGSRPSEPGTIVTLGSGFDFPSGVAVDASGNVFVAATCNYAVKILAAGGYTTQSTRSAAGSISLSTSPSMATSPEQQ